MVPNIKVGKPQMFPLNVLLEKMSGKGLSSDQQMISYIYISVRRFLPEANNFVILLTSFFTETTISLSPTTPNGFRSKILYTYRISSYSFCRNY